MMVSSTLPVASPDGELEYIRVCLERQLFPLDPLPTPDPALDWDQLFQLLVQLRLAGHFYALGKSCPGLWPASFNEALRREHYGLLLYGDGCMLTVQAALSALRTAGLDVIVLKGWALIPSFYGGDPSQRFCEDIDILVRPQDGDTAEALLLKAGFIGLPESWPGYSRRYTNARAYIHDKQPANLNRLFAVGLHWGLWHIPAYSPAQVDLDCIFERARPLRVAGLDVLELGVEDQVVYTSAHLWLHHRKDPNLFRYYEIAAVILRAGPALDWDVVIERACSWGALLPLRNVLGHIAALWDNVIPSAVLEQVAGLKPSWRERFVDRWNGALRDRPTYNHLLTWLAIPGLHRRLGIFFEDLFPGPQYMQQRYGPAPAGLWPLLYFRRLFRAFRFLSRKAS